MIFETDSMTHSNVLCIKPLLSVVISKLKQILFFYNTKLTVDNYNYFKI